MTPLPIRHDVTPARFLEDIQALGRPVLLKGFVRDWPAVRLACAGNDALISYLTANAADTPVKCVHGPASISGRFHYAEGTLEPNFKRALIPLAHFLDQLRRLAGVADPPSLAVQSIVVSDCLPGFVESHPMPLVAQDVVPRIWIGNAIKVATHHDPLENIACVVAGRRRFTVFPPDQVGNLYMGPFAPTPAGTPISMVHVTEPDFERYPRFREALSVAQVAELEPGDAIYLPYHWYHHVESLDPLSMLVNYWWNPARPDLPSPWDAMLHAMMSVRGLPPTQRAAWRAAFNHFVFLENGDPGAHLPTAARGILGADSPVDIEHMRQVLLDALSNTPRRRS